MHSEQIKARFSCMQLLCKRKVAHNVKVETKLIATKNIIHKIVCRIYNIACRIFKID